MNLMLALIIGSLFGAALYLTGASSSKKLISMLSLDDLSLMKKIVFGIGFSSVLLFLANVFGIFDISHLSIKGTNLGVIIGGVIFGLGFGFIGNCPGTFLAASSSGGFKKAMVATLGGLIGAFTFSLTYSFWESTGLFNIMNLGKLTLFNISDKYPSILNIGFLGLLIAGLIFMLIAFLLPKKIRKKV